MKAVAEAVAAFPAFQAADRAPLLRAAADGLEALGDGLLAVADRETHLGLPRLTGERARTCAQLRAFADLVDEGSYVDAIIDHADPSAVPPRPDLRRMQVPLGPVAVFGAGNFPLAFGVPGGDTASAWAAGCPVVFKVHPGHPETSRLCGEVLAKAVASVGLPAGVFSLVFDATDDPHAAGAALVQAPGIKAVGFTGSLAGGRALFDLAAARPEPIPVYAEMGSVNPLFVTAAALAARGPAVAEGFFASMTLGTGQFCTQPGLAVVPVGAAGDAFVSAVGALVAGAAAGPMLDARIHAGLVERLARTSALPGVSVVAQGAPAPGGGGVACHPPVLLSVDAPTFLATPELAEELFGPVSVVVRCSSPAEALAAARSVEGSLTATIHCEPADADAPALADTLRERVGRLVFNGYPTGVAVAPAMHHGGPWPATTAASHTSVGATAIRRFLRPVAYQDAPAALLPPALQDANPLGIHRLVDGAFTPPFSSN
ncbi:MAG TPA: aldehyde dehydrogenase (NADP(+)) [Acidimicrobiales bacterium]|nr:aldehyde dehydrogenase (NADP(+)) [Acidimicrobiales bacterium]